jgi:hypothetical protein
MIALLLAAALAAAPNYDTVTTADGTRLIGTVVEESPTRGVTIQLADGTTRRLERADVRRIEFSDGSVTVWEAPAAPPVAAPVQAAPAPQPAPEKPAALDTVYFMGGGRVRGHVLEEHPKDGVTIQLADGTVRHYAPEEIARIQYADGYVSRRTEQRPATPPAPVYTPPPAPRPVPQPVPQPAYTPAPQELPHRSPGIPPVSPIYGTIGIGGTWFGGQAERQDAGDVQMSDVFRGQFHLAVEGGLRLNNHVALAVYAEGGAGDVADSIRQQCKTAAGVDCVGMSGRFGFMVKHTWNPTSPTATWLGLGTGWEVGNVSFDTTNGGGGGSGSSDEAFTYHGREMVRLAGGVDFRSNAIVGVGLWGSVSWGTYDKIHFPDTGDRSVNGLVHETYQLGIRLILFP